MDIEFKNSSLKKMCTKNKKAQKKLGHKLARTLFRRLNELKALKHVGEIPYKRPYRRHKLKGDYAGCFSVDIKDGYRIIFKPKLNPDEKLNDIPLSQINKIIIWEVTDYHD